MLDFSPEKILLVLVIALLVLGPERLPAAARSIGRLVGQLRQMSGSLQNEVSGALNEPKQALMGTVGDLGLGELRDSLRDLNPLRTLPPSATPPAAISGGGGAPPAASHGGDLPPVPDDPSLN